MFPPTTIIIFIALAFASLQLASPFYILNYTRFSCDASIDFFATNSAYSSDLDTNLSTGFTNYTSPTTESSTEQQSPKQSSVFESVYGLALCRGDIPSSDCTSCISSATVRSECPSKKEAIVWREWCTLRYSNRYIFSTLEFDPNVTVLSENAVSGDPRMEVLNVTLSNVTARAAAGGRSKKFTTDEASYDALRNIYALAECTPDLMKEQCKECFRAAVGLLLVTPEGGTALLLSCIVRYEMYPLYFSGNDSQPHLLAP